MRMIPTTAPATTAPPKKAPRATPSSRRTPTIASEPEISRPPAHGWRTTDEDEINRRRLRAREESFVIRNADARFPIFSNFTVGSNSSVNRPRSPL